MLMENEVVMLVLGIGVLFLMVMNMDHVRKIRFWKLLFASYIILLSGWFFTILEGFILEQLMNILEHTSYFVSATFIAVWTWKSTGRQKEEVKV